MEEAHARLDINDAQWRAMMANVKQTLDRFKAPAQEQQELVAIVESTKGDIVLGSHR
jgi:hemoglobin